MSFAWNTARKDWTRQVRDPLGLVSWIGLPLIVGLLLTLLAGGRDGPEPRAQVLVADLDDSFLSGLLLGAMSQDAAGGFVNAERVSEEEGRRRIDRGDGSALLVIPEGFAAAVLQENPVTLQLVKNPSQQILPGIVEEALSILTDGTFYMHRLLGDDLRRFAEGPPDSANTFPDQQIADFSVRVNQVVDRLSGYLFPPLIELEVTTGEDEAAAAEIEAAEEGATQEASMAMLFIPGLLFMSLLFMAQGMAQDFWNERLQHTLRRIVVSPRSLAEFLLGKAIGTAGVMLVVATIALGAAWLYFGLPAQNLPIAIAWSTFSGVALFAIMTVIMLHASSERTAGILTMAIIFPLMMVGGSFFPLEAMPEGMAAIGKLTPNGWALTQLKAVIADDVDPARMAVTFGGLAAVALLLFGWSARRLRHGFAQG